MLRADCRVGLDAHCECNTQIDRYLVLQTRTGRKNLNDAYQFPLSELSRRRERPGARKDLRGNEAYKNNLLVLALTLARKGQSGRPLATGGQSLLE